MHTSVQLSIDRYQVEPALPSDVYQPNRCRLHHIGQVLRCDGKALHPEALVRRLMWQYREWKTYMER